MTEQNFLCAARIEHIRLARAPVSAQNHPPLGFQPSSGMLPDMERDFWKPLLVIGMFAGGLLGCEEEAKPPAPKVVTPTPEPTPIPLKKSPPTLSVDSGGPQVRGLGVVLEQPTGAPDQLGFEKLRTYLSDEKEFLDGAELVIQVARQAQLKHVAIFMTELHAFAPSKITIATDTRGDLPAQIEFVPQERITDPERCSLIGTITEDRGTAIWRLSGGAARKRGRGMGGPDLSMTGETILSMAKDCDSPYFFITTPKTIEWGLAYDLAASALALEKAGLKKAVVATKEATAGNPVTL
jgi:hypothetical protein